jgi:predicted transcriptional regulator
VTTSSKLSLQDRQRVDQFVHSYNAIDSELRRRLRKTKKIKFIDLVSEFEKSGGDKNDAECLRRAATLRNFIVHEPQNADDICAIPTARMVETIGAVSNRLLNPEKVVPRFARKVETVSPDHTLASVLKIIARRDFSQFPVYSGTKFKGLLTENGLTRWLAKHVSTTLSLVELEEVFVGQLLREEEQRRNHEFIKREHRTEEVRLIFRQNSLLEAALITKTGNRREPLDGIITRWDIIHS